ncbi:hypothetical protein HQ563_15400, partial [bacterium]|nr:hypothetical protein [bacterium]
GPCDGGNSDMSTAYLARWSGPVDESDDPYNDYDDRPSPGGDCQKYLESARRFTTPTDIKNAVMTYGALHTSMYWNAAYYNSVDYTYYYTGGASTNHAVAVVGWDDAKETDATNPGAWIIKNSWGASWGDSGYFYISYDDTKAVDYGVSFCYAVATSEYVLNYQYDPLGHTYARGYGNTVAWGANIFTPTEDGYLGAVGTYAGAHSTAYEIYIYDDFSGGQFSTLLGSTSGTMDNEGYHTITLPSTVELTNGDSFGIVVKFTTPGYNWPVPLEYPVADYASGATANSGESYTSSNGASFSDITIFLVDANVCIKGLTVAAPTLAAMSYIRTRGLDSEVLLEWRTEAEVGTAGFNVLRAESPEGPWVQLNEGLIPSEGSSWGGASYSFTDESREAGTAYWYCVEEVDSVGRTERYPAQFVWDEGLTDADGDDMPDLWEQRLAIDTGSEGDGNADADMDGATNLEEYIAGTSPVDAQDCPRLRIEWGDGQDVPLLTWPGRAGRTYKLVSADSLAELLNGSPTVLSTRSATSNGVMRFENAPGAEESRRFYRLVISPPW